VFNETDIKKGRAASGANQRTQCAPTFVVHGTARHIVKPGKSDLQICQYILIFRRRVATELNT